MLLCNVSIVNRTCFLGLHHVFRQTSRLSLGHPVSEIKVAKQSLGNSDCVGVVPCERNSMSFLVVLIVKKSLQCRRRTSVN